jgi:hypothetical protein
MVIVVAFFGLSIYLSGKISKYLSGPWPTASGKWKIAVAGDSFEFVKRNGDVIDENQI